jgi:hypothetical protein
MANDPRKQPSKAVVIKSLQTELKHRQREYEQLVVENASLRTKEVGYCVGGIPSLQSRHD